MGNEEKKEMETPKDEKVVEETSSDNVKEAQDTAASDTKDTASPDVAGDAPQTKDASSGTEAADKAKDQARRPGGRGRGGRSDRRPNRSREKRERAEGELIESVIKINRVAKVVKGGKNFSFNALVVAGDGKGKVGMGFGKSNELTEAISKGSSKAKKNLIKINMQGTTIPHEIIGKFKATRVLLKPASPGTGVIAGGSVRAICDAVGVKDILTKSLGSRTAVNVVRATINGFERLRLARRGSNPTNTKDEE